jgi:hypothetical protein
MSSNPPSITTLLPHAEMVGEARIRHKLAAEANTVVAIFIFLLAATAG